MFQAPHNAGLFYTYVDEGTGRTYEFYTKDGETESIHVDTVGIESQMIT